MNKKSALMILDDINSYGYVSFLEVDLNDGVRIDATLDMKELEALTYLLRIGYSADKQETLKEQILSLKKQLDETKRERDDAINSDSTAYIKVLEDEIEALKSNTVSDIPEKHTDYTVVDEGSLISGPVGCAHMVVKR